MNETELRQYILTTFEGVDTVVTPDNSTFFFYNPDSNVPPDHNFPFVTLMLSDEMSDQFSNLNRPSVYRLNIGVSKQTFQSLFGAPNRSASPESANTESANSGNEAEEDVTLSQYDFTAFDRLMPHPVYGRMYWMCVLNPTDETFEAKVAPLLTEAYRAAVGKYKR